MDIVSAHHKLGTDAREQIQKILSKRLGETGSIEKTQYQIRRARKLILALSERAQHPKISEPLKDAIQQYQACLSAWATGAELNQFRHDFLSEKVDEQNISPIELAIFLQEDEVGCQTGVFREQDGSIILWHSEEDYEESPWQRFDELRLFCFQAYSKIKTYSFIYPDLLPGPAFGWNEKKYAQAVDSLHIKQSDDANAILPNTLAWISLYLGQVMSRQAIATELVPFAGGYSISAAYSMQENIHAEKVDVGNHALDNCTLGEMAGNHLFQTNIVTGSSPAVLHEEQISPESHKRNSNRITRTTRLLQVIKNSNTALPLIFRVMHSRIGQEDAYSNPDVKAYFVCRIHANAMQCWAGAGPAMPEDEVLSFIF